SALRRRHHGGPALCGHGTRELVARGGLAEEAPRARRSRRARYARLWRVPCALRFPAARLLAARGDLMSARLDAFAQMLAQDDARIDLAQACLMIAEDAYPALPIERYLGDIERMALKLRARLPPADGAEERGAALNECLYEDLGVAGNVPVAELPLDQFLEPATNRQILARVLRNLKAIYRDTDQPEQLLAVLNRMLLVAPDAPAELRDRGIVYQRLECYRAALKDLSDYLEREPQASDLDEVRARLMEVSARCARLN